MIFNSTIKPAADMEFDARMEAASDELCEYTLAEATAMIIGEQESNWTRFMTAVGLAELKAVHEGQQVVYEGERLTAFKAKAIAFFETLREKLDKLVKSFLKKVDELMATGNQFVKKFGTKLANTPTPSDFKYKGYKFDNLDSAPKFVSSLESLKQGTTKDEMIKDLVGEVSGESFSEKVKAYYGHKERVELTDIKMSEQLDIIKDTKVLKAKAKEAWKKTDSVYANAIKHIKVDAKDSDSALVDGVLEMYKTYANLAQAMNAGYLQALASRNRQALAICTTLAHKAFGEHVKAKAEAKKAEKEAKKAEAEEKKETETKEEPKNEGFVTIDTFLGAVEFI